MVYVNDFILYDNDDEDDDVEEKNKIKLKCFEGFWEEGIYNNEVNVENKLSLSECDN